MSEFFHGWRRKAGIVTLVLACLFAAALVRSLTVVDEVRCLIGRHRTLMCGSFHRYFVCAIQYDGRPGGTPNSSGWASELIASMPPIELFKDNEELSWKWNWFGLGIGTCSPPQEPTIQASNVWAIPYLSTVIPLTLLSAYLLLSKARISNVTPTCVRARTEMACDISEMNVNYEEVG